MDATRLIALVSQARGLDPIVRKEIDGLLASGHPKDAFTASDLCRMLGDFAGTIEVACEFLDSIVDQTLGLLCPNAQQDAAQVFAPGQFVTLRGLGPIVYRILAIEEDGSAWVVSRDFAGGIARKYAPSEIAPLAPPTFAPGQRVRVDYCQDGTAPYEGTVIEDPGGPDLRVAYDTLEGYVDRSCVFAC